MSSSRLVETHHAVGAWFITIVGLLLVVVGVWGLFTGDPDAKWWHSLAAFAIGVVLLWAGLPQIRDLRTRKTVSSTEP